MNKLVSAEFIRLFKSFVFRLGLAFSGGLGIFMVMMRWLDVTRNANLYAQYDASVRSVDNLVFMGEIILIFAAAVVIGIFVGREYGDGTIRNKVTVGHTRWEIYLSKLIVCAAADVMIHLLYIFIVLAMGGLLLEKTTMGWKEIFALTLVSTMAMLALTALLLLLSMLIQSKASGSVACLLTVLVLFFAALYIWQRLDAPEYYEAYSYVDEDTGNVIQEERQKNPDYLTGGKRKVYEFLNKSLPVSQMYRIAAGEREDLEWMVWCDCVILIVSAVAGSTVFRYKNLR